MYYLVCGLSDLTIAEMSSLVKHAKAVVTTVLGYAGTDQISRRDALMVERVLDAALAQLAGKAGLASAAVDQTATCQAIGSAWKMSAEGPASVFIATILARAALESQTQRIAASRQPIAVASPGGRDWGAAIAAAVVMTAATAVIATSVTYALRRAKRQLAPRRRR